MPLLKREPDITAGFFELDPSLHPWRVAHVRSRQEKSLARHCHELGVPFYLPLTANEIVTRSSALGPRPSGDETADALDVPRSALRVSRSQRVRLSHNPLFPSYVFLRPSSGQRVDALRSNVIVSLLDVVDQDSLASELGQIHALQQAGAMLVPFPWLGTGDAVRIRNGAFEGYQGVIVKEKGEDRLVVSVTMLMRSVMVELGRESVVPGSAEVARHNAERGTRNAERRESWRRRA